MLFSYIAGKLESYWSVCLFVSLHVLSFSVMEWDIFRFLCIFVTL